MVKTQKKINSKKEINHKKTKYSYKKKSFIGGVTGQANDEVNLAPFNPTYEARGRISRPLPPLPPTHPNPNDIYATIDGRLLYKELPTINSLERLTNILRLIEKEKKRRPDPLGYV